MRSSGENGLKLHAPLLQVDVLRLGVGINDTGGMGGALAHLRYKLLDGGDEELASRNIQSGGGRVLAQLDEDIVQGVARAEIGILTQHPSHRLDEDTGKSSLGPSQLGGINLHRMLAQEHIGLLRLFAILTLARTFRDQAHPSSAPHRG